MSNCDIGIIGAGPYGLSAAAHLRAVGGIDVRVFGEPMSFWDKNMPIGMLLRSNWTATQIADPHQALTLEEYRATSGNHLSTPVPLDRFVQYGRWYQQRAVPDVDRRRIVSLEVASKGFLLRTEDGETISAQRVVVAAGIGSFAWRPMEFRHLSSALASHSSEHRDFSRFKGQRVLVIGSGQSALESGALLHESGADVEVVGRAGRINWLQGSLSRALHHKLGKFTRQLLYAPTDVGPAGLSQLMARPDLLRLLPRSLQNKLRRRSVRPAGARWLVARLKDVPIQLGRSVVSAASTGNQVTVQFDDGSVRSANHVLLGTGYRVNIRDYEFLNRSILEAIAQANGYPVLGEGLESSVRGLHFLGAPAAWSFGPLMQFVSGTHYASRTVTKYIAGLIARERKVRHDRSAQAL